MPIASEQELEYATQLLVSKKLDKEYPAYIVPCNGTYYAFAGEKSNTVKKFSVEVSAPEGFNGSHLKRLLPKILQQKYEDFKALREFFFNPRGDFDKGGVITGEDLLDNEEKVRLINKVREQLRKNDKQVFELLKSEKKTKAVENPREEISKIAEPEEDIVSQVLDEVGGLDDDPEIDDDFNIDETKEIRAGAVIAENTKGLPPVIND